MRQLLILINIFLLTGYLYSQTIDEITKQFIATNEVQYEYIGFGSNKSRIYMDYLTLTEIADINELILLTNHPNAVVKCYAGWGLIDKKYPKLDSIYKTYINNDTEVRTYRIDMKSIDNLSSQFYHRYWNSLSFKDKTIDLMLTKLDSITLYNPNSDWLLIRRALENRVYKKKFNKQIEYLAFKKKNIDAIFYLSNWYKAEYVDRLKPALIEYLQKTEFKKVGVTPYYQVIEELLKLRDEDIKTIIVEKLRKDQHWKCEKQRFIELLHDNNIYESDLQ